MPAGWPRGQSWLGLGLFVIAAIVALNAITKRFPQVGAALESL